jgi:hypothetical protein
MKRSKKKQFRCTLLKDKDEMFIICIGAVHSLTDDFEQGHNREDECHKIKN